MDWETLNDKLGAQLQKVQDEGSRGGRIGYEFVETKGTLYLYTFQGKSVAAHTALVWQEFSPSRLDSTIEELKEHLTPRLWLYNNQNRFI